MHRDRPPLRERNPDGPDARTMDPEVRALRRRHAVRQRWIQVSRQLIVEHEQSHRSTLQRDCERKRRFQIERMKYAVLPSSCQHDASTVADARTVE
jgi:hypothetical protein